MGCSPHSLPPPLSPPLTPTSDGEVDDGVGRHWRGQEILSEARRGHRGGQRTRPSSLGSHPLLRALRTH